MSKKFYDILSSKKCINCNSSFLKIIPKPKSDIVMYIGLILFLLNLIISIIPFIGIFFKKYLIWNFTILIIGTYIYYKENKNKEIYWIKCNKCEIVYNSELEKDLDEIIEKFEKLDESIKNTENRIKKFKPC